MCQFHATLLTHNGYSHGRGQIVNNYHHIGGGGIEIMVKFSHCLACQLVKAFTIHSKPNVRTTYSKIVKQRRLQCRIVFNSCIHKAEINVFPFRLSLFACPYYRCQLDEVWAGTSHHSNFTHRISFYVS